LQRSAEKYIKELESDLSNANEASRSGEIRIAALQDKLKQRLAAGRVGGLLLFNHFQCMLRLSELGPERA
jgi:hypothetical protein